MKPQPRSGWLAVVALFVARVPAATAEPSPPASEGAVSAFEQRMRDEPSVQNAGNAAHDESTSRGPAADRQPQSPNRSQSPNPSTSTVHWDPHWARAATTNYVIIGASFAVTAGVYGLGPGRGIEVTGSLAFDERVRDSLRIESERGRTVARDVSDVTLTLGVAQPLVFDAIVNAGWFRESPDVGQQLFVMDLSVIALTTAVTTATKVFVGRQRPYARECGSELDEETYDCRNQERELSFFSGHSSSTFAMASVTCVQNQYLPLWGSRWAPCAVGFGLAGGTATLRVVADQHYATDVITGAVVGTSIGLLVPLLHFEAGAGESAFVSEHHLMLVPSLGGAHLLGVF